MDVYETLNDSVVADNGTEFREARIAHTATLMIGTALLTQLMVLSSVAIIMGVAVVAMGSLVVHLLILTAVATVLERGIIQVNELGLFMELGALVLATVVTVVLAALGGNQSQENLLEGYPVAALKFV